MTDTTTDDGTQQTSISTDANPRLKELSEAGVSIWLDDLSRERLRTGNLQDLVDHKNVVGVTTNPTIFAAAIADADSYNVQMHDEAVRKLSVEEAVRMVTTYDVRWACDVLAPVSQDSDGKDGRVSIEVDPRLARDTEATQAEARALWWLVNRRNLFIKIPATEEGLPAITQAISEGISVNVTLIFSLQRYRAVMEAYIAGLEKRDADGGSFDGIESVASFFVSRVDTEYDKRLDAIGSAEAKEARGKAGIANAQLAYQAYEEVFATDRWKALEDKGAHRQRPLWASTGVKNPEYPDTMYVADLVAPNTVNTMPEKTLDAYADHGSLGTPIPETYADAERVMQQLADLGVDYDDVVKVLEDEGLDKFEKSWGELLDTVKGALEQST